MMIDDVSVRPFVDSSASGWVGGWVGGWVLGPNCSAGTAVNEKCTHVIQMAACVVVRCPTAAQLLLKNNSLGGWFDFRGINPKSPAAYTRQGVYSWRNCCRCGHTAKFGTTNRARYLHVSAVQRIRSMLRTRQHTPPRDKQTVNI